MLLHKILWRNSWMWTWPSNPSDHLMFSPHLFPVTVWRSNWAASLTRPTLSACNPNVVRSQRCWQKQRKGSQRKEEQRRGDTPARMETEERGRGGEVKKEKRGRETVAGSVWMPWAWAISGESGKDSAKALKIMRREVRRVIFLAMWASGGLEVDYNWECAASH